jgi:hypothetical protein
MIWFELANAGEYETGSQLEGRLLWTPKDDKQPKLISVRLNWHSSGRGLRDEGTAQFESFTAPEPLVAGQTYSFSFRFSIPSIGPVSYAGRLLQLSWQLYAEIDLAWAVNERLSQEIKVVPRVLQAQALKR